MEGLLTFQEIAKLRDEYKVIQGLLGKDAKPDMTISELVTYWNSRLQKKGEENA